MSNPLKAAFPGVSTPVATVRGRIAEAIALVLAGADDLTALDLAADGTLYPAVIWDGTVYEYDDADGTTPHDPEAGCLVSQDGRRYKRAAAVTVDWFVLDVDRTAPPAEPAQGDRHFVADGATGDWAGHDGEIAIYGRRGWHFAAVGEGQILYSAADEDYWRMTAAGSLAAGLPPAYAASSVETRHLASPFGHVVQAAQTTPPGSPSDRVSYIVAATATGAWAGQETKVAEWDSAAAAWSFYTPRTGDHVWDVAAGYIKVWTGSAWARAVAQPLTLWIEDVRNTAATGVQLSDVTLATSSSHAAASAANRLSAMGGIIVREPNNNFANTTFTVSLFADSEVTARDSFTFVHSTYASVPTGEGSVAYQKALTIPFILQADMPDASAHVWTVRLKHSQGGGTTFTHQVTNCRFEEIAG